MGRVTCISNLVFLISTPNHMIDVEGIFILESTSMEKGRIE